MGGSIHDGLLLHTNIQHYSSVQLPALQAHNSLYLSEHSPYSSLIFPRVPQQSTSTGLSQAGSSTQLKTALSSSLSHCQLTLDHKTSLKCCEQRSVFFANTDPTALRVQLQQSHYLTLFTGGPSSRTVTQESTHSRQLVTLEAITGFLHCWATLQTKAVYLNCFVTQHLCHVAKETSQQHVTI
jgi:hypothetical protein